MIVPGPDRQTGGCCSDGCQESINRDRACVLRPAHGAARILHEMIRAGDSVSIDERELWFTYARSSGPGGQHVNKVATKVTLHFDVANSPSLSDRQRARLRESLATRITGEGVLRVVRGRHRTQVANRRDAIEAFALLLGSALRPRRVRKKTKPSRASVQRRLEQKTQRGRRKRERGFRYGGEDI